MKFRISMFAALVAMCLAPAAFGQQYYNPQPVPPVVAPQQSWNTGAYQTPPTQNAAFANTNVAAAPRAAVACDGGYQGGCDSYGGGCGGGSACGGYAGGGACGGGACGGGACGGGACGGGGCGGGGCGSVFGGGLGGGCGLGGGGGLGGCLYDPCCPTKYFSIYGGLANFDAIGLDVGIAGANQPVINGTGFFEMNDGWAVGGAVGRSFGKRFRGELDFTYRNASVSNVGLAVGGAPLGTIPVGGKLNMYSFIPNIILDLNPNGRINGYIGVGAGVAFTDLTLSEPTIPVTVGLEASSFAYQGIAGVSAAVGQRAELFLEYRYFATDELSVSASAGPIGAAAASVDITSNNYFAGIRIKKW